jgi:RNA polymerase sigma-70 factor (ECF subfamily)
MAHEEQLTLIRKALEQLKEVERDVVMSVFAEGMSYRDTAEVLGIPEGTVKSRLHGALRHIKQILEQGGKS